MGISIKFPNKRATKNERFFNACFSSKKRNLAKHTVKQYSYYRLNGMFKYI
jgi:hypothetical protein